MAELTYVLGVAEDLPDIVGVEEDLLGVSTVSMPGGGMTHISGFRRISRSCPSAINFIFQTHIMQLILGVIIRKIGVIM